MRCVRCGKTFRKIFTPLCDACGGISDAFYDLERVRLYDSGNPYERFRELLPIHDPALLPRKNAFTPTIHAQRLGAELGMARLYLKDETRLPTGTTKDRMAAIALAYLVECGVKTFCSSSTGNSSTAYAEASRRFPGFRIHLFTAADFHKRVRYRDHPDIFHYVMRGASFAEASEHARTFARTNGLTPERGFFNLGRREGLKMAWLEAVDQVPGPIDWYVQAVSSAMGVYGTYKAALDLHRMDRIPRPPRLLCVQQETCAPMVRAWEDRCETIQPQHIVRKPAGIAQAILRGDPSRTYPIVRRFVLDSEGTFTAVSESQIREARAMVEELEGISPCFSASAAVAGLIQRVKEGALSPDRTVLVNLTGGDRSQEGDFHKHQNLRWLRRTSDGWLPEASTTADGAFREWRAARTNHEDQK